MGLSMDPSLAQLSEREICDKLRYASSLPPKTAENDGIPATTRSFSDAFLTAKEATLKVLHRVRNLLDLLEPLHFRKMIPLDSDLTILWSYSYSMIRWKSTICFLWPDLQHVLEYYEHFHRCLTLDLLGQLDVLLVSKYTPYHSLVFNICYDEISAMEDDPTVNIQARQHTLASLRHCIFHVYRNTFPKTPTRDKHKRESHMDMATIYQNCFPQTCELLPEGFQPRPSGYVAHILVRSPKEQPTVLTDCTSSQGSSEQLGSLSLVKAYVPAEITTIFNLTRDQWDVFEKFAQQSLAECSTWIRGNILHFSPWSISIALRAFINGFDLESFWEQETGAFLGAIIAVSFLVWDLVMDFCERDGTSLQSLDLGSRITTDRVALEAFLIKEIASSEEASLLVARGILKRRPEKASQ
jgi:hypothetical protein